MKEKLTETIVQSIAKISFLPALLLLFSAGAHGEVSIEKIKGPGVNLTSLPVLNVAKIIKGKVTDNQNQPLPGVSVVLKGTSVVAMSNTNGEFQLSIPDDQRNAVLVFTYIGFASKEVTVGDQQQINVKLAEAVNEMDEVVVIGYGSIKKSSLTASVSKVSNDNLDQVPSGRPETALIGKMAGVNISQSRSTPGAAPVIKIRGAGSIYAGNDPLIVIDGFAGGSLDQINMNDVESFEVLKDASSAAIYGSRASGGVIIVTTKKGKVGAPKLKLNTYYGIAKPMLHDDWVTGQEYYDYVVKYQNRELVWDGGNPSTGLWNDPARLLKYQVNPIIKEGKQTIWQDEVTQTAPSQSYNLAVSGGSESVKYYVSGTYNGEEGVIKTANYQFYGFRANVDVKVNKTIDIGLSLNPSYAKKRNAGSAMVSLAKYPSFVEPIRADGTYPRARDYWGANVTGQANPNGILNGTVSTATVTNNTGEAFVGLNIIEGLKFRTSLGANLVNTTNDFFAATYTGNASSGSASDIRNVSVLNENTLTYNKTFNKDHDFTALLGASYQKSNYRRANLAAVSNSFNNDILYTLDNAIINPQGSGTTKSSWGLISYFSRVNYAYKSKYLLAASMRTDGSSRFGPNNKWGYFPSASVGWRITEEDFMKSIPAVSNLKLRASYGVTGNFNIGDFEFLGKITSTTYSPGNVLAKGQAQTSLENLELKWERTKGYDVGLDLGLFDDRISLSVDYYDKKTTDMLYDEAVSVLTGFPTRLANIGSVSNKGIELELKTVNLRGAFKWQTAFNVAHNKNSVLDLGGPDQIKTDTYGMSWILRKGAPMFSYYGYKAIGVIQNAQDLANSVVLPGSKIGNPKYEDINKDGKITAADRVILGNYQPKVTLGMTNTFSYKSFDLSVSMQAALGAKIYSFENQSFQGNVLGAMRRSLVSTQWWSESEPGDGRMPGAALSQLNFQGQSDIYLENASFFSIRNLNLGYNLPSDLAKKVRLSSIRMYTSVNNLIMVTDKGFHGYNPEGSTQGDISGSGSMPGYNANGSEPINRVFTLGLNVGF